MSDNYGICLMITNPEKNLFYIQQKDETYPIEKYRLGYSLFGGSLEENETSYQGLEREISEELEKVPADIVLSSINLIKSFDISIPETEFIVDFYESIVPTNILKTFQEYTVHEGLGRLVDLQELKKCKFIYRVGELVDYYLNKNNL